MTHILNIFRRLADRPAGRQELAELRDTPECGWCGDPFDPDLSGDPDFCDPLCRAADDAEHAEWEARS